MKKAFGFLLHRNQRDFWYFWSQKYVQRANTVRPYTAHSGVLNNLYPQNKIKIRHIPGQGMADFFICGYDSTAVFLPFTVHISEARGFR